ncbi:hypothetical protein [Candidatus Mycalebacterium sp.]
MENNFMWDFERTLWSDSIHSAIGRALTVATRFENNCKGISILLELKSPKEKTSPDEDFISLEYVQQIATKTYDAKLNTVISSIAKSESDFFKILNKARKARNEIAHDLASGMESQELIQYYKKNFVEQIRENSLAIAEADKILCVLLTTIQKEPMPNVDFVKKYPDRIVNWVCDMSID